MGITTSTATAQQAVGVVHDRAARGELTLDDLKRFVEARGDVRRAAGTLSCDEVKSTLAEKIMRSSMTDQLPLLRTIIRADPHTCENIAILSVYLGRDDVFAELLKGLWRHDRLVSFVKNWRSLEGDSALHVVASRGYVKLCRLLCWSLGADISCTNALGRTPIELARVALEDKPQKLLLIEQVILSASEGDDCIEGAKAEVPRRQFSDDVVAIRYTHMPAGIYDCVPMPGPPCITANGFCGRSNLVGKVGKVAKPRVCVGPSGVIVRVDTMPALVEMLEAEEVQIQRRTRNFLDLHKHLDPEDFQLKMYAQLFATHISFNPELAPEQPQTHCRNPLKALNQRMRKFILPPKVDEDDRDDIASHLALVNQAVHQSNLPSEEREETMRLARDVLAYYEAARSNSLFADCRTKRKSETDKKSESEVIAVHQTRRESELVRKPSMSQMSQASTLTDMSAMFEHRQSWKTEPQARVKLLTNLIGVGASIRMPIVINTRIVLNTESRRVEFWLLMPADSTWTCAVMLRPAVPVDDPSFVSELHSLHESLMLNRELSLPHVQVRRLRLNVETKLREYLHAGGREGDELPPDSMGRLPRQVSNVKGRRRRKLLGYSARGIVEADKQMLALVEQLSQRFGSYGRHLVWYRNQCRRCMRELIRERKRLGQIWCLMNDYTREQWQRESRSLAATLDAEILPQLNLDTLVVNRRKIKYTFQQQDCIEMPHADHVLKRIVRPMLHRFNCPIV
ncbi:MAG: hypothetical protein MHM6MM_001470 [Cercozoa sp. M6MM]